MMRSDLRWCSDGFEFTCWNGEIVRGAFVLDAHDREVIAWRATTGAGISGSDIRDMMLEAVEVRFDGVRAAHPVEWISDNGSIYLRVLVLEAQTMARACGKSHLHNLDPEDLVALTVESAAMARVPLAGTSWIPGQQF
jgi:transposase InsO family protein